MSKLAALIMMGILTLTMQESHHLKTSYNVDRSISSEVERPSTSADVARWIEENLPFLVKKEKQKDPEVLEDSSKSDIVPMNRDSIDKVKEFKKAMGDQILSSLKPFNTEVLIQNTELIRAYSSFVILNRLKVYNPKVCELDEMECIEIEDVLKKKIVERLIEIELKFTKSDTKKLLKKKDEELKKLLIDASIKYAAVEDAKLIIVYLEGNNDGLAEAIEDYGIELEEANDRFAAHQEEQGESSVYDLTDGVLETSVTTYFERVISDLNSEKTDREHLAKLRARNAALKKYLNYKKSTADFIRTDNARVARINADIKKKMDHANSYYFVQGRYWRRVYYFGWDETPDYPQRDPKQVSMTKALRKLREQYISKYNTNPDTDYYRAVELSSQP